MKSILGLLVISQVWYSCSQVKSGNLSDQPEEKVMKLVWEDDFTDPVLNEEKWTAMIGDGCPDFCGFGNNELQYYSDREKNLRIKDGKLIIQAVKDTLGNSAYSSAKIVTKGKGDWRYGKILVRAKVPYGRGTWPAIWMLPTMEGDRKWPLDGEIDIMEHVGYNQGVIYGTIHSKKYNHLIGTQKVDSIALPDAHETFHDYSLEWTETSMTWSIDSQPYYTIQKGEEGYEGWPFDQPFHLILNLAVGGNWGGKYGVEDSIWPQTLEIDFVKIYQ